jgi:hypothetical protein
MKADHYNLLLYHPAAEYPTEHEFIIVSSEVSARSAEVSRITEWYQLHSKQPVEKTLLSTPAPIDSVLISEDHSSPADWQELRDRVESERKTRPRGDGCIFFGASDKLKADLPTADLEDLRGSIRYFMKEQRVQGPEYLFIGSAWDETTRMRTGKIGLFQASSIQLASSIVHLHYLGRRSVLTLTDWCCPICIV